MPALAMAFILMKMKARDHFEMLLIFIGGYSMANDITRTKNSR